MDEGLPVEQICSKHHQSNRRNMLDVIHAFLRRDMLAWLHTIVLKV